MPDAIRTFIAVPIPRSVTDRIREIQKNMKRKGFRFRPVRPENIHLTLKFLGNIEPASAAIIRREMASAAGEFPPLSLSAGGIGVFPGVKRPRVLWMGLAGETDALIRLAASLEDRLEAAGFPREKRPYRAHLTIARIREAVDTEKLVSAMTEIGRMEAEPFEASELILYRSDLRPSGAIYTPLKTAALKR